MTQQTPFFEPPNAMDTLEAIVTLESEITRLRANNAEMLAALAEILEAARDNDMFRVGQYVSTAIRRAKGEQHGHAPSCRTGGR